MGITASTVLELLRIEFLKRIAPPPTHTSPGGLPSGRFATGRKRQRVALQSSQQQGREGRGMRGAGRARQAAALTWTVLDKGVVESVA